MGILDRIQVLSCDKYIYGMIQLLDLGKSAMKCLHKIALMIMILSCHHFCKETVSNLETDDCIS